MASAFSSNDDVISRRIECSISSTAVEELSETYEISRCVKWILGHDFKKIALQFSDHQLIDATYVCSQIQSEITQGIVFVLGDTSYGSCCVDEVGAQHYNADSLIHYGHACLSKTCLLPVLYVFGRSHIDVQDCVMKITRACEDDQKMMLFYDTTYHFAIEEIYQELLQSQNPPVLSSLCVPKGAEWTNAEDQSSSQDNANRVAESNTENTYLCGRTFHLPCEQQIEDYSVIFIGDPSSPALLNMMMTLNRCSFYTYNPSTKCYQLETMKVNKALMKRYYLIERLKDANIIGIVAGTLGVANYKEIMDHVKSLIRLAGRKSYTFVVGKINPAKLANFAEVDMYVYVACRESSLIELSDFYRPVVTPLEVEFAFNKSREWTGMYSTDFQQLLPGGSLFVKPPETIDPDDAADVSLISNKVRSFGVRDSPEVSQVCSQELVKRNEALAVAAVTENAGEFLSSRSWQGLERKLGETPVTKATEGTDGIAFGYKHEPVN